MSVLVAIAVLAIACGVSSFFVLGLARLMAARETSRAKATLEKLHATAIEETTMGTGTGLPADQEIVLLEGKLIVDGEGCSKDAEPFRAMASLIKDGEKVAAATRWLSRSRLRIREPESLASERAKNLRLELADGTRLALEGPVNVILGSRLLWLGTATYPTAKYFDMATALRDGDRVLALGLRRRVLEASSSGAPEHDGDDKPGDYRAAGGRVVLTPLHAGEDAAKSPSALLSLGGIRLAATMRPSATIARRNVWRHPIVILATALAIVPAIAFARDYSMTEDSCIEGCAHNGTCRVGLMVWVNPRPKSFLHLTKGDAFVCVANTDKDCHKAEVCREHGWCSAVAGRCIATKAEECAMTDMCINGGWCSVSDGTCKPMKDEDCKRNQFCASLGHCSAIKQECTVGKDADCAQTSGCTSLQSCTARDGSCVATDRDCVGSMGCIEDGKCSAPASAYGSCSARTDDDCKASTECVANGRCSVRSEYNDCVATSDEDCLRSMEVRFGRVRAINGVCGHDVGAPCAESAACRVAGRCGGDGVCEARSDRDCAQSTWCKERGACTRFGDECAASCAATLACRERGLCSAATSTEPAKCRANSDQDCKSSFVCKKRGQCTAIDGVCKATTADCKQHLRCREYGECTAVSGECKITSDADCRESSGCRSSGQCVLVDGRCKVGKPEDCENTSNCKENGRCFFRADKADKAADKAAGSKCDAPNDAECRAMPACRELGRCSAESGNFRKRCVAKSPTDCKKSAVCEKYGWCDLTRRTVYTSDEDCFISRPLRP